MKACQSMVYSESSTVGGLPILSPQPVLDILTQLDSMLKKLEEAVMDIIKDIDGKKKVRAMDYVKASIFWMLNVRIENSFSSERCQGHYDIVIARDSSK